MIANNIIYCLVRNNDTRIVEEIHFDKYIYRFNVITIDKIINEIDLVSDSEQISTNDRQSNNHNYNKLNAYYKKKEKKNNYIKKTFFYRR